MDKISAKQYLQRIKRYQERIERLQEQIMELRDSMIFLHAIVYDRDRVQTSPQDVMPAQIGHLMELEREYVAAVDAYHREKREALDMIDSIENPLYARVLTLRYIDGASLETIANETHYTYKYVSRVHGWALLEIQKKLCEQRRIGS